MKQIKTIIFCLLISCCLTASAFVASSTNFIIETDAVSYGGGLSTSTNFSMQDSLGDKLFGTVESTSYSIISGYIGAIASSTAAATISITFPTSVALSPRISTADGGQGNGTASVVVTTNSSGGYSLSIKASTDPALVASSGSFDNYAPASSIPDFTWSVARDKSMFGFTPEGADIASTYKDNGVVCSTGTGDTADACWDSIETSTKIIATSASSNSPSGTATSVKLRAEAGAAKGQPNGSYSADITFTALAL